MNNNDRQTKTTSTMYERIIRPLSLLVFVGIASTLAIADQTQDRAQLKKLNAVMQALQKELNEIKKDRNNVQTQLESNEKAIGELTKKAKRLENDIHTGERKLQQLQQDRKQLQQDKTAQEAYVAQHIAAAYRLGSQSHIRLLLNQRDPATVARMMRYYKHIVNARSEKISGFLSTITQLNRIEPEIASETDSLKGHQQQLRNKRDQLRQAQTSRKTILATLESRIANQNQELGKLSKDRSRLEKLLSRVEQLVEDIDVSGLNASFASLRGRLPWPSSGKVLRQYGSNRSGNTLKWEGMLIGAPSGADVSSVHYGRIVFADYLRGHGLLIIVDHGDNYMTLYAHNQALHKELGEWVNAGDIIATVGNSGGQQQSALYFELRHQGRPQNPKRWLKSA